MEKRRAEERRAEERRSEKRKSQKKEDPGAPKLCVFPMICGSRGSKSRLAKAAGAKPAGQMRDEKLHAVVEQSTFASQNVQSTPGSEHFWKLRCRKSARCCGVKHISKSTCTKHTMLGPRLEVAMSKKCTPLWREAHFEVKMYKAHHVRATFGSWDVEKVYAVVARSTFRSKNVQTLQLRSTFRSCDVEQVHAVVARSTFRSQDVKNTRGLEPQIFGFAEMILRDRCSTPYDLASLFHRRRSTLDRWSEKIATRIGTRPSAQHSTFHFWRKSPIIASFLMLSTLENEEVSQNCFVFWCCQLQKLRKSRRIASFSSLQIDR